MWPFRKSLCLTCVVLAVVIAQIITKVHQPAIDVKFTIDYGRLMRKMSAKVFQWIKGLYGGKQEEQDEQKRHVVMNDGHYVERMNECREELFCRQTRNTLKREDKCGMT